MIRSFADLRARAAAMGPLGVAVAGAESATALEAADAAAAAGIARPLLVGDEERVRDLVEERGLRGLRDAVYVPAEGDAAAVAVKLAGAGEAAIVLKGSLRTDELLRAVLSRNAGLRTGRVLSDVLLYEDTVSGERRLVGVTDGGINVAPDADTLKRIVVNAVAVFHALGFTAPRVGLLSATEAVSDAVPSTAIARAVAEWASAELPGCEAAGPLALDNALLHSAAAAKGITGPVAGRADVLVAPSLEAGNILGKAVKYLGGSAVAHVVVGARVPILIPSRVESAEDKLNAIALGVVARGASAGDGIPPAAGSGAASAGEGEAGA